MISMMSTFKNAIQVLEGSKRKNKDKNLCFYNLFVYLPHWRTIKMGHLTRVINEINHLPYDIRAEVLLNHLMVKGS